MKVVHTEIEINAGTERVWNVLIDFEKYDQWNPFINKIVGRAVVGTKIEIHIETRGDKNRKYEPTVTKVEPSRELRWLGRSLIPGFLKGEHIFTIEQLQSKQVRFIHREVFDGFLTSLFGKSLDSDVKKGFEEMNKALKVRVEHTWS